MWWVQPLQIADANGQPTGRWRMTAKSDEDGGGPYGDTSHDHASAEEAQACDKCDEYTSRWAGFPTRKQRQEQAEAQDRREYERLKAKFEPADQAVAEALTTMTDRATSAPAEPK